jgi:alkylhydroperoxidase family enzyme
MPRQRISYIPLEQMTPEMRAEMDRCATYGTPRPESSAVRAHVPACFWFFANSWDSVFRNGVLEHAIKELCRVYVSRSVICEFCGNQRSIKGADEGLRETHYDDLIEFEKSTQYNERQKAALSLAEAMVWRLDTDDAFWARMHQHFTEPQIVELGCAIGLTHGQQSFLRLLNIHHQVMAGTAGSMAPGAETAEALEKLRASPTYWAKKNMARK